jgi:hypothetical protein
VRENPKYRERNRYVNQAYALVDDIGSLKLEMGTKYPKWIQNRIDNIMREVRLLVYPLTEYRREVPPEIEE